MAWIGHAVVVGASVAGMVSAAALAGHAERVTVVDRDSLPEEPGARKGTPQARHLHSLMASGLPSWPKNLLVLGDATCALNPVYAQGMSVAAMSAVLVREHLGRVEERPDCAEIQRALASTVDRAWTVAVGADHALLSPADAEIDEESRRVGEYMERVLRVALVDAHVNKVFFDVMMMLEEPARLFAPDVAERAGQGPARFVPATA